MKPYQARGLMVVGVCVAIGGVLGLGVLLGWNGHKAAYASSSPAVPTTNTGSYAPPNATPYPTEPAAPQANAEPIIPPGDGTGLRGLMPQQQASQSSELRVRAQQFALAYFTSWSGDNQQALDFIERSYAPLVRFYGVTKSRDEIASAKLTFMQRWPQRSYRADPSQLSINCNDADGSCIVSGVVQYDCRSAERNAASSGVASFEMGIRLAGPDFQVVSETGQVLNRRP